MAEDLGKPLGDRVLLRIDSAKNTKSSGGIYVGNSTKNVVEAEVVAVSDGFVAQNGEFVKLNVEEGDRVLVGSAESGDPIRMNGQKYNLVRENEILMKLRD